MVQHDPTSPRSLDRRAEIIRRAATVFREKGFHAAGMREIAAGLGMAPGALYYYFPSKEELLYACQDIALRRLVEGAQAIHADGRPADEQVRALIAAHLELTLHELGGTAAHMAFSALPPERLAEVIEKRDAYEHLVGAVLQAGIDSGVFRPVNVKLTLLSLMGALNWTVVWWRPEGEWDAAAVVEGFADVFLSGLRADDRRAQKTSEAPAGRTTP